MGHIYVMSDIHGNWDAFIKMLDLIEFKDEDTLYVLGDVIDRGKDGIDILEFIRGSKNINLLMGNHEEMMYDAMMNKDNDFYLFATWVYRNGGLLTYHAMMNLTQQERNAILAYVNTLDRYKILELNGIKYLLVHAGLRILHNFTLEELLNMQGDDLLWIREKFLKSKVKTDYKVVFGHTPVNTMTDYLPTDERIENNLIWISDNKIGIDCGCGFSEKLACLRLNDMKEYYIDILQDMKKDKIKKTKEDVVDEKDDTQLNLA